MRRPFFVPLALLLALPLALSSNMAMPAGGGLASPRSSYSRKLLNTASGRTALGLPPKGVNPDLWAQQFNDRVLGSSLATAERMARQGSIDRSLLPEVTDYLHGMATPHTTSSHYGTGSPSGSPYGSPPGARGASPTGSSSWVLGSGPSRHAPLNSDQSETALRESLQNLSVEMYASARTLAAAAAGQPHGQSAHPNVHQRTRSLHAGSHRHGRPEKWRSDSGPKSVSSHGHRHRHHHGGHGQGQHGHHRSRSHSEHRHRHHHGGHGHGKHGHHRSRSHSEHRHRDKKDGTSARELADGDMMKLPSVGQSSQSVTSAPHPPPAPALTAAAGSRAGSSERRTIAGTSVALLVPKTMMTRLRRSTSLTPTVQTISEMTAASMSAGMKKRLSINGSADAAAVAAAAAAAAARKSGVDAGGAQQDSGQATPTRSGSARLLGSMTSKVQGQRWLTRIRRGSTHSTSPDGVRSSADGAPNGGPADEASWMAEMEGEVGKDALTSSDERLRRQAAEEAPYTGDSLGRSVDHLNGHGAGDGRSSSLGSRGWGSRRERSPAGGVSRTSSAGQPQHHRERSHRERSHHATRSEGEHRQKAAAREGTPPRTRSKSRAERSSHGHGNSMGNSAV